MERGTIKALSKGKRHKEKKINTVTIVRLKVTLKKLVSNLMDTTSGMWN